MQTLLIVSASAFAIAALAWFTTWAFWIHPPEGWVGKAIVTVMPICEIEEVRHAKWFRWLKIVTILMGLITLAILSALITAHISQTP